MLLRLGDSGKRKNKQKRHAGGLAEQQALGHDKRAGAYPLALQWDSVYLDTDAPYLTVWRAWRSENNRPVISTTLKTKAARRNVPTAVSTANSPPLYGHRLRHSGCGDSRCKAGTGIPPEGERPYRCLNSYSPWRGLSAGVRSRPELPGSRK